MSSSCFSLFTSTSVDFSSSYHRTFKRQRCYDIYRRIVGVNRDYFRNPFAAVYDSRNLFFSLEPLKIPTCGEVSYGAIFVDRVVDSFNVCCSLI